MMTPDDSTLGADYSSLTSNQILGTGPGQITLGSTSNMHSYLNYKESGSTKVTLGEAEHLVGYQLLIHSGNLTKIIQTMKELRKSKKQLSTLQQEVHAKQVRRQTTSQAKRGSPSKAVETERLIQQKRELHYKYDQRRAKFLRNERQKEQFRSFLFSNMRGKGSKHTSLNHQEEGAFEVIPPNMHNLYFDSIEGRNFTQIKIDLFSTAIRRHIEGFLRKRGEILERSEGKRVSLKIMTDMNHNLKRKYVKKCLDYKRACKGEEVEEPQNFLQKLIQDIKQGITEKKAIDALLEKDLRPVAPPVVEHREEEIKEIIPPTIVSTHQSVPAGHSLGPPQSQGETHTRSLSETQQPTNNQSNQQKSPTLDSMMIQQQQLRQQRMENFEVKTISERSHEDSNSISSTPGHHRNYLSGSEQQQLNHEVFAVDYQRSINDNGGAKKPQIQILELLNEICEENEEEGQHQQSSEHMDQQESATEKEEDEVIQSIMKMLQGKEVESEQCYQSLTYTDGIYLQNITGDQLQMVLDHLHHIDDPNTKKDIDVPKEFGPLVEMVETAEYLGLDDLKLRLLVKGVSQLPEFIKFTNVRRHYLENLDEDAQQQVIENLPPSILLFVLSDPALDVPIESYHYVLENLYRSFTVARLAFMEKMKDDESQRYVFEEDLMQLTKEYYEVYNDTVDNLKMKETVARHVAELLVQMRDEFRALPFDFHSCFYFDTKSFKLHRRYLQQDDNGAEATQFKSFKRPLVLLSAVEGTSFAETCLVQVFGLSRRFQNIRVLNLRGLVELSKEALIKDIIPNCNQVAHLNLSFIKAVDDEVAEALGAQFRHTLISLELRSCQGITDAGITKMCECLSGLREALKDVPASTIEMDRRNFINRYESKSTVKYFNISDIKQLTNLTMKAVAYNLFPQLVDLSIWGCYRIDSNGFLELCTAHRSENFRRVNYCGCYKIGENSRLWISSSFPKVIIYNKVDEFGKEGLNYDEVVDNNI